MGYVLAAVALVLWGLVQIPIKLARAPGRTGIVVSMAAGLVSLGVILLMRGGLALPDASWREWLVIGLNGLCHFSVPTYLYYDAIRRAGISNASPVTRLTPVLVVIGAVALGMSQFSWGVAFSAALVFVAGMLLAKGAHDAHPVESRRDLYAGLACAFVASVIWAVGDLLVAGLRKDLARSLVLFWGLAFSGVFHLVLLAAAGRLKELRLLAGRDYVCFGIHGLVSFAVAYWAFFESIQMLGVSTSVVITGCWPLVGVLAGIVIFRERMNLVKLAGIVLFVLSAVLAGLIWWTIRHGKDTKRPTDN